MKDECSLDDKALPSLDDALSQILQEITPLTTSYTVKLYEAVGRVLADDINSPINLPFDRNSAMDGYALNSQEIRQEQAFSLPLAGTSWAGKPYNAALQTGECIRIFTGAVVPDGADTVIMQEMVNAVDEKVVFPAGLKPHQNVRLAGEDVKVGNLLQPQGKRLTPADIGLLAAAGIRYVPVVMEPNVAFFATGDELARLDEELTTGKIYDSNRYVLDALLADFPVNNVDMGIIVDNKRKLKSCIKRMSQGNNLIISIGGASVGKADYIKEVLAELGEVKLWKIAVKPGKPLIFAKIGECYYFGLPGNPISMMMTFQQIVAPALNRLCGARPYQRLRLKATCLSDFKKSPGRMEFQRGNLSQDENGNFSVKSSGHQGSHMVSVMSRSNCYIILPAECSGVKVGESVLVEPFSLSLN